MTLMFGWALWPFAGAILWSVVATIMSAGDCQLRTLRFGPPTVHAASVHKTSDGTGRDDPVKIRKRYSALADQKIQDA